MSAQPKITRWLCLLREEIIIMVVEY